MRATISIDDALMRDLKQRAERERISLTRLVNRLLRQSLSEPRDLAAPPEFQERTYHLGEAKVNLDKALVIAAALEDYEMAEKLARRK